MPEIVDPRENGTAVPGLAPEPAPKGRIPHQLSPADRMRRKLRTKQGAARYQLRQESVEPVFGQIKEARGFRRFSLRVPGVSKR